MDYGKLKGNLGLKSSALAPTACKLSTQFLVLDHMSNHYMKIAKAKSAVDSRPPKSLVTSQKMRDRKNRNRIANVSRSQSISSTPHLDIYEYEDILKDEPVDEEERLVHSIMRSTLLDKSRGNSNAMYESASHFDLYERNADLSQQLQQTAGGTHGISSYGASLQGRPASARSAKSGHSLASSCSHVADSVSMSNRRTCKGDVLERRPHLFTEPERPFTPRTLKNNSESRLKHSKCYNPPRSKGGSKREKNPENDSVESQRPQATPRARKHQKAKDVSDKDIQDTMKTAELSESMLMDITLRSRDEKYIQEKNHSVPPLDISVDKDHMNWLQEQASKAEARVRSSGRLKSSLYTDEEFHPGNRHHPVESGLDASVKVEKQRKEEEQKYLAFAKEVTDDVLSRGICTDSVLLRVFENHIERRKHDLDEGRMRKVISDLHKNLGLKDTSDNSTKASLHDSTYNSLAGIAYSSANNSNHNSSGSYRNNSDKSEITTVKSHISSQVTRGASAQMEPADAISSHGKMSSTLEKGAVSATITKANPEGEDSEKSKLASEWDRKETEGLKQYTPLNDERDVSSNARESRDVSSEGRRSIVEYSLKPERPGTGERRLHENGKFSSDMSLQAQKTISVKDSPRTKETQMFRRVPGAEISPITSQDTSDKNSGERVTVSDLSAALEDGNTSYYKTSDNEDASSSSQQLPERPRPRARLRRRQSEQRRTAAVEAGGVTHEAQESGSHRSVAEGQQNLTPPPDAGGSMARGDPGSDSTGDVPDRSLSYQHHHQKQSDEEGDEYEEDYEEAIASEDEGQGDSTHRTSDDDF